MTLKACITGWGCVCKVFRTFSSLNFLGTRRRMPRLKWKVNKTGHSTEWKGMLILDSFNKYLLCATVCLARWWWASSLQKTSMFKEENNKPMNHQREEISNSELKKKKIMGAEWRVPGAWFMKVSLWRDHLYYDPEDKKELKLLEAWEKEFQKESRCCWDKAGRRKVVISLVI